MKLQLTQPELERLNNFEEIMEYNIKAADSYNIYMNNFCKECSDEIESLCETGMPKKDAFSQIFLEVIEEDDKKLIRRWGLDKPELMSSTPYDTNEYRLNVKPKPVKSGKWELFYDQYMPYEGFVYNNIEIERMNFYQEITPFAFFLKPFDFLSLKHDGETWMCITPHEINTMKGPIERAHGRVLTYGLGLGYYAYMASLKENVEEIAIVEKDEELIELFKKYILPFFPHPEKIKIMPSDAFMLSEYLVDGVYDTLFIDIWHTELDALPLYLKFKNIFKDFKKTQIDYWIEDSILAMYRRAVITLIAEEIDNGGDDKFYQNEETFIDKVINTLHFELKEKEFNSISEIYDFLDDESLKTLYLELD